MPLYAGICETNITPPIGVWMCGYAFRPSGCIGIHDELFARALVVNDGHTSLAILSMDLLGLDFDLVNQVRAGIHAETGIEPAAIMLSATHTHGGPNVREFTTMGSRDPAYVDMLARKLIGATKQASANMRPAKLAYGRAPIQIGVNRRQVDSATGKCSIGVNFAGPVAPHVDTLSIQDSAGTPKALLFCHACHPTTLGGDNLLITGDYPAYACKEIKELIGSEFVPSFLQGCAGNINPHPRGSYEDVRSHGAALATAALDSMLKSQPIEDISFAFEEKVIPLPLLPPPPAEVCLAQIAEWTRKLEEERRGGHMGRILHAEGLLRFAEFELAIAQQEHPDLTKPFAIQQLSLGGVKLLGMPGEMFVQYGLDFQRQSPTPVFPVAYANGVHGYVPTSADYPFGGYEVDGSHRYYGTLALAPECERLIRQAGYELLGISEADLAPYSI